MALRIEDLPDAIQVQIRAQSPAAPKVPKGQGRTDKFGPAFKSDLERDVWNKWIPSKNPVIAFYEQLSFHMPSGGYKPDFLLVMPDGEIWIIEAKGWNKNLRADRRKFLEAVNTHSWAHWCWLTKEHGQWKEEWF